MQQSKKQVKIQYKSRANSDGITCYNFSKRGNAKPIFDILDVFSPEKVQKLNGILNNNQLNGLITQFSIRGEGPKLPRYNQGKILRVPNQLTMYGEIVDRGVQSIGQEWLKLIPAVVLRNKTDDYPLPRILNQVQEWILSMILFDYPGIVYCGKGHDLKETMVLGIASRIVGLANSSHFSTYHSFNSDISVKNAMVFENYIAKRPFCIVFYPSGECANEIFNLFSQLLKETDVLFDLVTEKGIKKIRGKHKMSGDKKNFSNILVGTPEMILRYFQKLKVPLDRLDSIFVYGAEHFKTESEEEWDFMLAMEYIHQWKKTNFSTFLFCHEPRDLAPFFDYFIPRNCSILNTPSKLFRNPPKVKLCMCEKTDTFYIQRKLPWLNAIINQISIANANQNHQNRKETTVIVATTTNILFLAGYLSRKVEAIPVITKYSENVIAEGSLAFFKGRGSDFLLIDLPSLSLLEPGYIVNVILYDFPSPRDFFQTMNTLTRLSSKIVNKKGSKNIYLMIDPKLDLKHIPNIYKFMCHIRGEIPRSFELLYQSTQIDSSLA